MADLQTQAAAAWLRLREYAVTFDFQQGVQPLSSWQAPAATVALYFTSLILLRKLVAWRGKPLDAELRGYVLVHNFGLALLSSFLLAGIVHELVAAALKHRKDGALWTAWLLFCDPAPHQFRSGLLVFLYYLNYLTKYAELSDTVLLCLRGKPLPFLHVYHHAATLVLCWTQLAAKSGVQWVPIVLNLMVHVPMYYYYAIATLGRSPWWKKYLTTAQIVQFCVDVPATGTATLLKMNAVYKWGWFGGANTNCGCDSLYAAYFGTGLLLSYLFLFIDFFIQTYKRGAERRRKARADATKKKTR